jgi:hypothetical protein
MRRFEKKAILHMLDTIEEAHKEYKKFKKRGDWDDCVSILTSCQEAAVSIGNAIEKAEGDNTESVKLLEKYCEDLYQLSQRKRGISLDTDLINIRNTIRDEISVILEVVFFPYKASMWDSMESIYLAFKERNDVNVYLVPIPYYNRKNDGTVESMHCESDLFPTNEPVTDWKAFDIEKIKPDIAFVHNPYDDMNFVTTVDPRFYSYEIKKNTDCLVYCPYYSTEGGIPKGQSLCKAYLYADYILTQNKYQIGFYDKAIPRDKFLPMGSPKFDKVIGLEKEKISKPEKFYSRIPDEWLKKSKGRKIYFYNTSLTNLLSNTNVFLDKMKYVFDTFSSHTDAIILWRPHPLIESTLKAMRPEYYDKYQSIRNEFINSGLGIFDDTPDISLSVAFCDVFIGDGGTSVTSLFNAAGKPLFILNDYIHQEPDKKTIEKQYFSNTPYEEQSGYMITCGNLLFKGLHVSKYQVDIHFVKKLSEYSFKLYGVCFLYNDKLYITPVWTDDVLIYHKDGSLYAIKLKYYTDQPQQFFGARRKDRCIFLIPDEYPYIVRIDMDTEEIKYTDDFRSVFVSEDQNYIRRCGVCRIQDNDLIIESVDKSQKLVLDTDSLTARVEPGTESAMTEETVNTAEGAQVVFDIDELRQNAYGFSENAPWGIQYSMIEDSINSLGSFLAGIVYGAPFDKQKALESFKKVAVNLDGTCGQHVCDFLMKKMEL